MTTKKPGRPAGTTNAALGKPSAKRTQVRLYPADLERAQRLVEAGYGSDRSAVVRRALELAEELRGLVDDGYFERYLRVVKLLG